MQRKERKVTYKLKGLSLVQSCIRLTGKEGGGEWFDIVSSVIIDETSSILDEASSILDEASSILDEASDPP